MSVFRLSALLGCLLAAASTSAFAAGHYPVTLENCGMTLTFEQAPSDVVTVGQSVTEALYALDLGERMAGTSRRFNDVLLRMRLLSGQSRPSMSCTR